MLLMLVYKNSCLLIYLVWVADYPYALVFVSVQQEGLMSYVCNAKTIQAFDDSYIIASLQLERPENLSNVLA